MPPSRSDRPSRWSTGSVISATTQHLPWDPTTSPWTSIPHSSPTPAHRWATISATWGRVSRSVHTALVSLPVRVPSVLGSEMVTHWAEPCLPFGGLADQGLFMVPEVGAQVWVEFEEGDPSRPIWTGTTWQQSADVPTEAADRSPSMRQLKTPSGHILSFDDTEGEEEIRRNQALLAQAQADLLKAGEDLKLQAIQNTEELQAARLRVEESELELQDVRRGKGQLKEEEAAAARRILLKRIQNRLEAALRRLSLASYPKAKSKALRAA